MRHSVAILSGTPIRLADLRFPARRVHIHRTRLAYIHLDNLLHFAKIDRDGRVDGYIVAYLPDELNLLFLRAGELVTAVTFSAQGRAVRPIASVLRDIRGEIERGELAYCEAPLEQLGWMYQSGAAAVQPRTVDSRNPRQLFSSLQEERFTGVLELIVDGEVSYFRFKQGEYRASYYGLREPAEPVPAYLERLFASREEGPPPASACLFARGELAEQASPAMVEAFREVFWRIAERAEQEVPGEAMRRGLKLRDTLRTTSQPLAVLSTPREAELEPCLLEPGALSAALTDWTRQLLDQLEIIAPGVAPGVLREATREHRYVLQRAGFYTQLPWSITW